MASPSPLLAESIIIEEDSTNEVVVSTENVYKKFCKHLRRSMAYGIVELATNLVGKKPDSTTLRLEEFWALNNVSFELKQGESLGLVGMNGSGKTTLLRLLTGIFPPDKGRITIKGRVGAMIAVGAGFHPHMTGRENVYLNGSILGMHREEIESKFHDIVDFAEIEDFLDAPVSTYSSGMYVRLGFSIAVHLKPELLLVDEIIAVGDMSFQRKCMQKVRQYLDEGGAVILVSHTMDKIRGVCQRGIFLDQGKVMAEGPIQPVIADYINAMVEKDRRRIASKSRNADELTPSGTDVWLTRVEVFSETSERSNEVASGETVTIRMHYSTNKRISDVCFGVSVWTVDGVRLSTTNTNFDGFNIPYLENSGYCDCQLDNVPLLSGIYFLRLGVYDAKTTYPYHRIGWESLPVELIVKAGQKPAKDFTLTPDMGIIQIQTKWTVKMVP